MRVRTIFHIDMDCFFVAVERTRDPSLKGKPVIVGGDPGGRGVVAAASYEARKFGIHSAMPLARARKLCPRAIFLRGSGSTYGRVSHALFSIFDTFSPLVQGVSIDEAYLDATGCSRLYGSPLQMAETIVETVASRLGLDCSIGIAANKLVAKIGSDYCKPRGIIAVSPGRERAFLAPLPVDKLPGVGRESAEKFGMMGIKTAGDLAGMQRFRLEHLFGAWGKLLHARAMGEGSSRVCPGGYTRKSVGKEITFETDQEDISYLECVLSRLSDKAAGRLRALKLRAGTVSIKLRYSDFRTVSRSRTLPEATAATSMIFYTARELLQKLFTRRARVRLLGVSLSGLSKERQTALFYSGRMDKLEKFYQGVDAVREKYGFSSLFTGRACLHKEDRLL